MLESNAYALSAPSNIDTRIVLASLSTPSTVSCADMVEGLRKFQSAAVWDKLQALYSVVTGLYPGHMRQLIEAIWGTFCLRVLNHVDYNAFVHHPRFTWDFFGLASRKSPGFALGR